jgi:hypothetical protein
MFGSRVEPINGSPTKAIIYWPLTYGLLIRWNRSGGQRMMPADFRPAGKPRVAKFRRLDVWTRVSFPCQKTYSSENTHTLSESLVGHEICNNCRPIILVNAVSLQLQPVPRWATCRISPWTYSRRNMFTGSLAWF